jgi:5-formyltetrahydrofolate cyclo-ligase
VKRSIRKEAIRRRDAIPLEIKKQKETAIQERLFSLPEFLSARTVLLYASFRSEVETLSIIHSALNRGKKVVLPRVDAVKHILKLYEISAMEELTAGYMGIPEPEPIRERLVSPDDADMIIIPGAAFDRSGNRLGYGAGYYDILLSEMKKTLPVIALAYDEQIVDSIPPEKHDITVDMIITDKEIILTK